MLQTLLGNNTQPCYCHVKMMGVNIKEMFNCTYENLYPLKKNVQNAQHPNHFKVWNNLPQ